MHLFGLLFCFLVQKSIFHMDPCKKAYKHDGLQVPPDRLKHGSTLTAGEPGALSQFALSKGKSEIKGVLEQQN